MIRSGTKTTLFAFALAGAAAGCTDAGLREIERPPPEPPDNTVTVSGSFCTEDPETVAYPVKVWLVIDDTGSMKTSDPQMRRWSAAQELATALEDPNQADPKMFFGAMKFALDGTTTGTRRIVDAQGMNGQSTPRFTPSAAVFNAQIQAAANPGNGNTPYVEALNLTFGEITADVNQDGPVLARRTRYVVIFLSDGQPTGDGDTPANIDAALKNVMTLGNQVGDITVNTIFLGGGDAVAEALLQRMAADGHGLYKSFPVGDQLDYSNFDFSSIRRSYNQRFFLVSNLTALPTRDGHQTDSDADGLRDELEDSIGSDPTASDTDLDGCSDLMEVDVGWDPVIPGRDNNQCVCTDLQIATDTDLDGLTDCEEKWVASDPFSPDSDRNADDTVIGDLVFDSLDSVYLDDVNFPNDGLDFDADGVLDLAELRTHTDPHVSDDASRKRWAYDYVRLDQQPDNTRCWDFRVDNVALLPTLDAGPLHAAGENLLLLYFAQSPQDNGQREKSFRVARKRVPLSMSGSTVRVEPSEFSDLLEEATP